MCHFFCFIIKLNKNLLSDGLIYVILCLTQQIYSPCCSKQSCAMKNTGELLFVSNINWRLRTLQKIDVLCVCVYRLKEE